MLRGREGPPAHQRKALVLETRIERERLVDTPLSHRHEGHRIDQAQEPFAPLEQQIEAGLVEGRIDPDDVEERREVRAKAANSIESEPPADEGVISGVKTARGGAALAGLNPSSVITA